ncbi:MAG TPA: ferredoxin, partial [Pelotomaculum sp.]|nr:ferredoxin [Pelotomaculum sp.]
MSTKVLSFTLNGEKTEVVVAPSDMLADVLRDKLNLIGCKKGCGQGECGA